MSDAEETSVVVERDGVRVEKSFEPDDFPVPAIAFTIASDREEAVDVTLVDRVPEDVAAEDIGFHPQFGAEFWSVDDGRIVFEREFDAGEEYTTVYGLRARETDDVSKYMSEPDLDEVDPGLDSGQAVRDVIGGDDEDANGASSEDEGDGAVEPLDLNDPGDGSDSPAGGVSLDADPVAEDDAGEPTAEATHEAETDSSVDVGDDSLVAALTAEVREGEASAGEVEALRDALGVEREGGSMDARISRLQSDVSDLEAYTDALEEFLDENGDAQTLVREVREDVQRVESEISDVEERASENAASVNEVDDRLDALVDDLDAVRERVEGVDDRIEGAVEEAEAATETAERAESDASDALDAAESADETASELADDVDSVHEDLGALRETVDETTEEVSTLDEDVDDLSETVSTLEGNVDVAEDVDERVAELESELEEVREDIEDLRDMRDRLTSAFGGVGEVEESDDGK